ncbi:hypothetical protein LOAG_13229, partial [Loa loa]
KKKKKGGREEKIRNAPNQPNRASFCLISFFKKKKKKKGSDNRYKYKYQKKKSKIKGKTKNQNGIFIKKNTMAIKKSIIQFKQKFFISFFMEFLNSTSILLKNKKKTKNKKNEKLSPK